MRHTCWKNSEKNVLKGSLFSCVISCFWVAWKYTYFKLRASKAMFFYRKWRLFLERAMSWYNEAICLIVDLPQIHKLLSKVTFRIFLLLLFSVCFFFLSFPLLFFPDLFCSILFFFLSCLFSFFNKKKQSMEKRTIQERFHLQVHRIEYMEYFKFLSHII